MGRLIKILLGVVLVLVLLVVAAVVVIPLVVDPNDFRDDIVAEVKKATGRDLAIRGDIGLSVFPWLGVSLGEMSLSQPKGFGDQPFAAVSHAQVRAKLMPLLQKRLEVDRIELQGLRLNLIRNAQGLGNWEDLAKGGGAPQAEAPPAEQPVGQGGALAGVAIGGVQVSDARVSWDDRQDGRKLVVQDLSLETGEVSPDQPLDLKLGFALDNKAPALTARVDLSGRATPSADGQRIKVQPFELRLSEINTGDGLAAGMVLDTVLDLDLAAQQYRLDDLTLQADAKGARLPGGSLQAVLRAALQVDWVKETLGLDGLDLQAAGLHLTGELAGNHIKSDPSFKGRLKLAQLNVRDLLRELGMEGPHTADSAVLQRFSLSTELSATTRQATLDNLDMALDDSTLTGNAKILLDKLPGYRFALALDAIDLDRYLPPPTKKPAGAAPADAPKAPVPGGAQSPLFPVELLRSLDLDGSFQVGHLVVSKLKLDNARITVKARDGDLKIDQRIGAFYQGNLGGSLGIDVKGKTPILKVAQHVTNIQAEPLVKDLTGQDRLSGTGNVNLDVTGSGQTVDAIKRSLDGTLHVAFTDGTVKGVNLGRLLREAAARLKGKSVPADQEPEQTDFSELSGSAVIKQGVLRNEDLEAKSPLFRVTGMGTVDIGRDTLDYKIRPVLVASLKGQGGEDLDKLKGVPIPVHLKGPLSKPEWSVDLVEALTESQKARLKEKVDEKLKKALPEDVQKKLPGGLGDALKGLL
jgi:AsmA protein